MDADAVLLLGAGESSDAHHMSAPHPQGRGARAAMEQALTAASLAASDIHYINLHGTGTPSNDEAEACAVAAVLGPTVPGSSTKGATGHTLGAAGALEAVICALALREGFMPAGVNTRHDRSGAAGQLPARQPQRTATTRHEQLLRLRRLQLQPGAGAGRLNAADPQRLREGVGLLGPGLTNWAEGAGMLSGQHPWASAPTVLPPPEGAAAGRAAPHRARS